MRWWNRYLSALQYVAVNIPARLCLALLPLLLGWSAWLLWQGVSGLGLLPGILALLWCLLAALLHQLFASGLAAKPDGSCWVRMRWYLRLGLYHLLALLFLLLLLICLFWSAKLLSVILRAHL